MKQLPIALLCFWLTGCTVGPDYAAPPVDAPAEFVSQEVLSALNEPQRTETLPADWWSGFNDPQLSQLVEEGLARNHLIIATTARVKQAQGAVDFVDAGDALSTAASGSGEVEERRNLNSGNDTTTRSLLGSFGAFLPLDIFGRTERQVEAARANLESVQEELKGVVLTTSTEIASEYLSLRGNQRQLELLKQSVELQEKTLSIVRTRYEVGLSPELDMQRAITSVENLRARIPPLKETLLNSRNRLATLTGRYPGAYEQQLSEQQAIPVYAAPIPQLLPLEVLQTRPDVRQAEADLKQTIANIGVAESAYYPTFELAGSISIGSTGISGTPTLDVLIGALSALIEQVVTDGGARAANLDIAQARAEEELADYERILRTAMQDVEASLAALKASQERLKSLQIAVNASERSFNQAQTLYQQGLISFLDVVDAQRVLADALQSLATEQTDYATEIANLFRVLGTNVTRQ